jgi:hypothetical protein
MIFKERMKSFDPNHLDRYQNRFRCFLENALTMRNHVLLIDLDGSPKLLFPKSTEKKDFGAGVRIHAEHGDPRVFVASKHLLND